MVVVGSFENSNGIRPGFSRLRQITLSSAVTAPDSFDRESAAFVDVVEMVQMDSTTLWEN